MKLLLSNNKNINLNIDDSPLGVTYQKIYKNLSHVNIPFRTWDNPYYFDKISYKELVYNLVAYGKKVSVEINVDLCLQQNQEYFNSIHKIYEKNYDGTPAWLDFHEHIHLCEQYLKKKFKFLHIDYREKSGLLEKKFNMDWMITSTNTVKKGDIFVDWAELGKIPYTYWKNNEPNDLSRLCELSKPWLTLRPKILIALEDHNFIANKEIQEFNTWWETFRKEWCRHWKIDNWTIENMFAVNVFGNVLDIDNLVNCLKNDALPTKVMV